MKNKLRKILFAIFILVVFLVKLNASSIKCIYPMGNNSNFVVTYDTTSRKFDKQLIGGTQYNKIEDNLSSTNFTNSDGTLNCLSELYIKSTSVSGRTFTITLTHTKKEAMVTNGNVTVYLLDKENSQIINDTPPSNNEGDNKDDGYIDCKYGGSKYSVIVHYNKTTKEIISEAGGKCTNAGTSFTADNFSSGKCPGGTLVTDGGRSGTGVYCTINPTNGDYGVPQQEEQNTDTIEENNDGYNSVGYNYGGITGKGFGPLDQTCIEIVGATAAKIIKSAFNILRILGAIIAIVNAMVTLIPAVASKNADGLKKAANKCVKMAIVLAAIGIFPSIVRLISSLFGYDITCLI